MEAFLNSNFTTVDDLRSIDDVTTKIKHDRSSLTDKPVDTYKDDEESAQLLRQLSEIYGDCDFDQLDKLTSQYGQLSVFQAVREMMLEKVQLESLQKLYEVYLSTSNDIKSFTLENDEEDICDEQLKQLQKLHDEVMDFADTDFWAKSLHTEKNLESRKFQDKVSEKLQLCSEDLQQTLSSAIRDTCYPKYERVLLQSLASFDKKDELSTEESKKIGTDFDRVLKIQLLDPIDHRVQYPSTIWAMDCVCQSFKIRFIYHFEGPRNTNKLGKPEYALEYTLGYIQKMAPLVKMTFSDSIDQYYPSKDACECFITSILAIIREKLKADCSKCVTNGELLSHLIVELQHFDKKLVDEYAYGQTWAKKWAGLTYDIILVDDTVFNQWLDNEKEFVNRRYDEIVNADDAFKLEYGFVEKGRTQPTKSAVNMSNLLDGITKSYENLPLEYQLKFLSDVQLKLLNFYYNILLQGFNALDSVRRDDDVSYIERLCRVWCSADYMVELMSRWGEKPIYIELWNSINPDNACENTFFDSVNSGYRKGILDHIPSKLRKYVERQLNGTMKSYFACGIEWSAITKIDMHERELDAPIKALSSDLEFLQKTVSATNFRQAKMRLSEIICAYFERNFIWCNTFSKQGALQLGNHIDRFYDSLGLVKDYHHYKRLMEMIDVLSSSKSDYVILSARDISDLSQRRSY